MTNVISTKCICNKEKEISEIHTKVDDLHKFLLGNGHEGMLQEFNQVKGAIKFVKWGIGGGWIVGLSALLLNILR